MGMETEDGTNRSEDKSDESVAKRAKIEEESVSNDDKAGVPGGADTTSDTGVTAKVDTGASADKQEESVAMEVTSSESTIDAKEIVIKNEVVMETNESTAGCAAVANGEGNVNEVSSGSTTSMVMSEEKSSSSIAEAKPADDRASEVTNQKLDVSSGNSQNTSEPNSSKAADADVDKASDTKVVTEPEDSMKEEKTKELFKFKNDNTDDIDETSEAEHTYFNTRQDVLQLCQGNHYQFDQLRRAKHTSMMILYHLHNPDAPKFVPICTLCSREILVGYRYRCDSCDVDYCQTCVQTRGPPQNLHPHPLRAMAVQNGAPTQLTEEQRKERQKSIDMHLHLLKHAANCVNKECKSKNCLKMKEFLKHGSTCPTSVKGGCPVCKRINNLLTLHARSCRVDKCPVPKCLEMREQMRQIELRQQQMDDRRRAMMNSMYNNTSSAPAAEPD